MPTIPRRVSERLAAVPRRELRLLAAAIGLGLLLRLVYVIATWDHQLAGDEIEYHIQGSFIAEGKWFWSTTPYGEAHPSLWKTPVYPVWVGVLYSLLGKEADAVILIQVLLLGPLTIALTWQLGRRLFGAGVGTASAFVAAIHPFVWQFEARLFAEALATPLTLGILSLVLDRRPSARTAAAAGALSGVLILAKPSAFHIMVAVLAAIWVAWGFRRAVPRAAAAVAACVLVIVPWTIRNYVESDAFVPFSVQDASIYGVFNDEAANDEQYPFAWRLSNERDADIFTGPRLEDAELRAELRGRAFDYIEEHPDAVPKAIFWNGLSRFWDIRRPRGVLNEVEFQGRSRTLTWAGLVIWWVLLPLGLAGLFLARGRRGIAVPLALMFALSCFVYLGNSGTRYRAPFEPIFAVLACSAGAELLRRRRPGSQGGLPAAHRPG